MTTKHTPGLWYARGNQIASEADTRGATIALIADHFADAEVQANARLIAAAPELLEALRRILKLYESDPDDLETMDAGIKIAESAIAKAEGGTTQPRIFPTGKAPWEPQS